MSVGQTNADLSDFEFGYPAYSLAFKTRHYRFEEFDESND